MTDIAISATPELIGDQRSGCEVAGNNRILAVEDCVPEKQRAARRLMKLKAGRAFVEQHLSWPIVLAELDAIYRETLHGSRFVDLAAGGHSEELLAK